MPNGRSARHTIPSKDVLDPRQALFLSQYLDPKHPNFANAKRSALASGFSETYAASLAGKMPEWISLSLQKSDLVSKAHRNIKRILDLPDDDPNKLRVMADMTKFVAEKLDRENFASRTEITGPDGGAIQYKSTAEIDERLNAITAELAELNG